MRGIYQIILFLGLFLISNCSIRHNDKISEIDKEPLINPDYSGVTIPVNIAPLNFQIKESGEFFIITFISSNGTHFSTRSNKGIVKIPEGKWNRLLKGNESGKIDIEISVNRSGENFKYKTFHFYIATDPSDPYICYRLIYPGYETYVEMKIMQRNIENFKESSVVENQMLDMNCVNCHSFRLNDPEKFLIQVRGSVGGAYIVNGKKITRTDLKTDNMKYGAVYPAWHPGGKFVVFSSNNIIQSFHAIKGKRIEVRDLASSLVLYDVDTNEITQVIDDESVKYMDTFPEWSPDGNFIYFCRTNQVYEGFDFKESRYNLMRRSFDPLTGVFGEAELIFDAQALNKSVSFPRISPDGNHLVFTMHDYGTFSIWHKEADLYHINLLNGKVEKLLINSDNIESYHSWSSNGRWLIFSSKRIDGLTARPYFAYFSADGEWGKPFVLPQKDPTLYNRMVLTFNRPEFITGKIKINSREFAESSKQGILKAKKRKDQLSLTER